ncbi:substrate-binding periplasmic protein [Desulfovibrio gilichinskyi]|uniref:Polar amino acid transport system substrate-binding protein n=1 Tax=Desulfovibrio gilichinskyi TaxID=1519643 RepID=A0A1X7EPA8_9BACT|nr:transporter substrate-binding domain-containing protein [Desulfovibrio gilichinskyi]SMF37096.1 polar amino acid transport system substrate-binding protein [Desulfovibrio gilichinskyi]
MRYIAIMIILNCLLAVPVANAEHRSMTFTTGDDKNFNRYKSMNEIVKTCFARMGIEINIIAMPSERSLYNANAGIQDGNFMRIEGISKDYPNLIMVPEPLSALIFVAFSRSKKIKIDGWESLLPYRVAWIKGWKICDQKLSNAKSATRLKSEENLFLFLERGRADIGVFGRAPGEACLKKLGITDVYPLSPPIAVNNSYIYVHKKHARLIPQIVKTLQEMKHDGTFQKISDKYDFINPLNTEIKTGLYSLHLQISSK